MVSFETPPKIISQGSISLEHMSDRKERSKGRKTVDRRGGGGGGSLYFLRLVGC